MSNRKDASLGAHFASLPDPRIDRTKRHLLHDVLAIAICGVICGADDWVSIEQFGEAKQKWFRGFLSLPNGIPSHDTFGRIFAALDTTECARCFTSWVSALAEIADGEVVAIDGKTVRRSFDRASGKSALHMVSAWASTNRLVLGQVKTDEKSNEITAIPKLLEVLELRGCIVTIDAMGCQKGIAALINAKQAGYLLGLKGNQGNLHAEVAANSDEALRHGFVNTPHDVFEESGHGHGRSEHRRVWCTNDLAWFAKREEWVGLRSIAMVEARRTANGTTSNERRYYISSLPGDDAKQMGRAVRLHWGVENGLHWVLDVAFREDDSRVRKDNGPENLAMLRHIAINLLKNERTAKIGEKNKRLKAGWDEDYLLRVLGVQMRLP